MRRDVLQGVIDEVFNYYRDGYRALGNNNKLLRLRYQKLQGRFDEANLNNQRAIDDLNENHQREIANLNQRNEQADENHRREIADLNQRNKQANEEHQREIANLNQRNNQANEEHQREIANLNQRNNQANENHQREIANLKESYQGEIANLNQRNNQANEEHQRVEADQAQQIVQYKNQIEAQQIQIQELSGNLQNLKDLVKDFELRDQQNTNEINRLQREVDDLQDKNNNQVVAMNNVRNENNQQVAKINARYEDKIAKNNAEHNQQVIALKNQHSQELISLNDQINALKQANEKGEASSEDFFNLISKLLEGVQKLENEMGFDQEEINNLIGISNGIQEHYNENHVISHDDYNALNHIVEELFIHAHDMNQANISERNNMNQFLNALNERINAMIPNDANYDILNDAINYFTNDGIRQASYHGIAILFNILKTQRQTIRNYENALISARQGAFLAQRDVQRRSNNLYHAGMAAAYIVSSIAFFWLGKKVSDHQHEYLAEMALQALTYEENNKALNQQLEESIKNEENAQQENEMLQEENKNLKKENMKLKNENARAKQALRSVNAKAKTYEEKYYNLNSYFEEFKTNSTNKYNNLFNLYQDKDKKYQHVEKMLKKNDFDINKLINSNTKLEEENRNLTRKNDELQSLNKQYDNSYKSLLNKTQNVTKILDMVKKRNEKGTNELMKIIYQLEEKDKVTSKDLAIFKEKTNYWMQKFIEADQNRKALADS